MSLRQKAINGLLWTSFSQGCKQFIQLGIIAVMARLLSPNDFGLIGIALIFIGFGLLLGEMGIGRAIIQKQNVTTECLNSVFWLNILTALALTIFLFFTAPFIAVIYHNQKLELLLKILSINFIFSSFVIIPEALITKKMDFKTLMLRDLWSVILGGVVGIVLALLGMGVWSLVWQQLAQTMINTIYVWNLASWQPKFYFSKQDIKDIFHFGKHVTGFDLVNYITSNLDLLLIGRFLGSEALGYYSLAFRLVIFPLQNLSGVISKVIFPAFAQIQNNLEKIQMGYLKVCKAVSLLVFPLLSFLFVIAPEIVDVFFGAKWRPAVPIVRILCFMGIVRSISPILGTARLTQNRAKLHFHLSLVQAILSFLTLYFCLKRGLVYAVLGYSIFLWFWYHFSNHITLKIIHLNTLDFFKSVQKAYAISLVILCVLLFMQRFIFDLSDTNRLFVLFFSGGLIYIAALFLMKEIAFVKRRWVVHFL